MGIRRFISFFTVLSLFIGLIGAIPVLADYSDDGGILTWDFAEYTTEISGDNAEYANQSPISINYNGVILSIEKQNISGRTDIDKINTSGIHWSGSKNSNRYVSYTPKETGMLIAEGSGSWNIATSKGGSSLGSTNIKCSVGNTYYIQPNNSTTTIKKLQYITDSADVTITATASINNMYGDNMLLQREKPIKLDGTAENADGVEVKLTKNGDDSYENKQTASVSSGKWSVTLDAIVLDTPTDYQNSIYSLTVTPTSDNEKTECVPTVLGNIKFGDLYLCGGQSNMWYYLNRYIGIDYDEAEINFYSNPNIRIMQEPTTDDGASTSTVFLRKTPQEKLAIAADWQELTPDYAKGKYMPALIYSMAKELYEETGVPIGMLGTAVGNTAIALWRGDGSANTWYASRIHPLRNFEISGIFWYQGCNDKNNGNEYYEKNMRALINEYRALFGNDRLPFYYVQLARNGNVPPSVMAGSNDDTTGMKDVRRAQFDTYYNASDRTKLGLVSTLDIYGEKEYISGKNSNFSARVNYHTAQKAVIAHRLTAWALKDIYNMDTYKDGRTIYTHGPVYKSKETDGNTLVVEFETSGDLRVMPQSQYADNETDRKITADEVNPAIINEFEIAGTDGEYKTATAQINGNKLILSAEGVTSPVSVRYAYSAYPESPNLTDDSGLPAYAFTAEEKAYPSWKFDFGTGEAKEGYTRVDKAQTYGKDSKSYGFLGLDAESSNYKAVVDGYNQRNGNYTTLTEGLDYVRSTDKQRPVRFAMKVDEPNSYYKVRVTLSAEGGNADVFLTSERRHFILTNEPISDGDTLTKEFTAAVHNVRWKNRDTSPSVEENYTDDMLNISLLGENAALKSIEIQQIKKPKVLWIFGDSTVTDHVTDVPVSHSVAEAGWGAAASKYVNEDVAVVNLSEGGLNSSSTSYFDRGKDDISAGDVLMVQMGHNDKSTAMSKYLSNFDYYKNAAENAGADFVLCSPISRLTPEGETYLTDLEEKTAALAEHTSSNNINYIDLNKLTNTFNTGLGSIKAWYTHVAYWQAGTTGTTAFNDGTHLNDYGSDNTCRMALSELAGYTTGIVAEPMSEAIMPSEELMKNNGADYVMPPYRGNEEVFPWPGEVDFEHEVELYDEVVTNGKLMSIVAKRNVTLSYITVFAAAYDERGTLQKLAIKRLEPASADAFETVDFSEDNIEIPENGTVRVFVWDGSFDDGSMKLKPRSENYEVKQ